MFADWFFESRIGVADEWVNNSIFEKPPISFMLGGKSSTELFNSCQIIRKTSTDGTGVLQNDITYKDPGTGLECTIEIKEFKDVSAIEWVSRLKNTGNVDTPIIEDIQAMDILWPCPKDVDGNIYYSKGSNGMIDDFMLQRRILPRSSTIKMAPDGGRSSSGCLPFFNLQTGDKGIVIGIGWTGQWAIEFSRNISESIRVRVGLQKTRLKLHPDEEIRMPSILLIFWQGDWIDGNNMLRRFIIKYRTPTPKGKQVVAPICCSTWGGMRSQHHFDRIQAIKEHKLEYDYYWIDAGWYGPGKDYSPDEFSGEWANNVGNWDHDPATHPDGLKPISDAVHESGMKFLLWIEPERAIYGTPLTLEHPDWFLGEKKPGNSLLLNIGLPEAREWLINFISQKITEYDIDCYRQDFNIEPLALWRANDEPDREGMTEIRYIEGLYEFWDRLLQLHPDLLIDNCASGGRRIDLETIGRSIPLWRSDYECFPDFDPIGSQVQTYGLSLWIPLSGTGTQMRPNDTYNFRSAMSAAIAFHLFSYEKNKIDPDYPWEWHRSMISQYKRARPFYYGDFYPLTSCSDLKLDWMAYQLNRSDTGDGMILALRRTESPLISATFKLRGLKEDVVYEIEDVDSGKKYQCSGADLMTKGINITMLNAPDSKLFFYKGL